MESLDSKAAKDPAAPSANVPRGTSEASAERPGAAPAETPPESRPETSPEGAPAATEAPSPAPEGQPAPESAVPEPGKGKKVSPWKLVDDYKGKLATAEKVIADLKSSIVPEVERKQLTERVTKAEARAAQHEETMRMLDYEKTDEFQTKYHKPYEAAFQRQMREFSELVVPGENGQSRPFTGKDFLELVFMDRKRADAVAKELFGDDDAREIMAARREVKGLWDERQIGLDNEKKNGAERLQTLQQNYRTAQENLAKTVKETWNTVNAAILDDPELGSFFKPREGDQKWNELLTKGTQLVDEAFNVDPRNPNLTPEQRVVAVKKHAALRNMARAFRPMRYELAKVKADLAAALKKLDGYKSSTPPAGGSTPQSGAIPTGPGGKRDRLLSSLDKLVHH